jgi:lipopolysaccharide transport system ATP-binding protein
MSGDVVIRAEGLGKQYMIGHQAKGTRHTTLRDAIVGGARGLLRSTADVVRGRPLVAGDAVEAFWALKNVSFEVRRGEVMGIIGRNGAGKSTLLKILSRITEPSEGRVTIKGRVASLLEVGTGFHPELSGRENIYLNGAILGMSRAEIRRKLDEIVAFAEVEKFLDTPVKRYSSGMYVRLAFAVAAHLDPEILVVDEVLAVGDAEFQRKCLGKMGEVARGGRTVLLVSHNIASVQSLCSRCISLLSGKILSDGDPIAVVADLYSSSCLQHSTNLREIPDRRGNGRTRFLDFTITDEKGCVLESVSTGQHIRLKLTTSGFQKANNIRISVAFSTAFGATLFVCSTELTHDGPYVPVGMAEIICGIPRLPLAAGPYLLTFYMEQDREVIDWIEHKVLLTVNDSDFFGSGRNLPPGWEGKCVLVDHYWLDEDDLVERDEIPSPGFVR